MVLTDTVDTLENLYEKKMFIGDTHSHVYNFSNSFPGQKTQIPEPGTWQRCYSRRIDETLRKVGKNKFEDIFLL